MCIQEHGNSKKVVGNACALAALSKLFMMGAVEAYQSKEDKKMCLSRDMPDLSLPHNLVQRAEKLLAGNVVFDALEYSHVFVRERY